jgi:localization factor PodJL
MPMSNKTVLKQAAPVRQKIDSRIFTQDPISMVQELLRKLGFNVGSIDGRMNPRTSNAIRLFQLQSGAKVTGEVTDDLISQLQAKLG